ncbi:MAG: LLM class F420-dependent oxidoreductase [Gammaproteobacteria bacterium]|nr:LLM class F420-dependent oxidoreductase [Gammaproteobacteria bacterium]
MTTSTTSDRAPRLDLASPGRTVRENIELATLGERAGWTGFWVAEATGADAVATAAAVAARLESNRVGTAILPMQTRDPLLLAMAATSVGQVAPGGFVLGLGTSTPLIIEDWHATPWGASPLQLTRECVDLVRRFLAGERITTDSGRWRYRRAQLATPPSGTIPVYLAALNDRMLELAGEIADGVILNFVTPSDVAHAKRRVAAGAARVGRDLAGFELMVFFRATVTDDYEEVRERYQRELFTYVMAPVYQRMFAREGYGDACREIQALWRAGERQRALDSIPPALIRERTLIGSATDIRHRLQAYADAGVDSSITFPVAVPDRDYLSDTTRIIEALGAN